MQLDCTRTTSVSNTWSVDLRTSLTYLSGYTVKYFRIGYVCACRTSQRAEFSSVALTGLQAHGCLGNRPAARGHREGHLRTEGKPGRSKGQQERVRKKPSLVVIECLVELICIIWTLHHRPPRLSSHLIAPHPNPNDRIAASRTWRHEPDCRKRRRRGRRMRWTALCPQRACERHAGPREERAKCDCSSLQFISAKDADRVIAQDRASCGHGSQTTGLRRLPVLRKVRCPPLSPPINPMRMLTVISFGLVHVVGNCPRIHWVDEIEVQWASVDLCVVQDIL